MQVLSVIEREPGSKAMRKLDSQMKGTLGSTAYLELQNHYLRLTYLTLLCEAPKLLMAKTATKHGRMPSSLE